MSQEKSNSSFTIRAAWLSMAQIASFMLSFLMPLVIVRVLIPDDFGVYKQLFQVLTTALALLNLQFAAGAYFFMPREPEKQVEITVNIVLFYAALGTVIALFFIFFPGEVNRLFPESDIRQYVPLLGVAIMLWLISSNLEVIPLTLGDVRMASAFIVLAQIVKTLLIIGAALIFKNVKAILWASIIEGAAQTIFMSFYIRRRLGSIWRPIDFRLFKRQLSYSIPYGAGGLTNGLKTDLHNYFILYYFSPATFAVYSIGTFQLPLLNLISYAFTNVLTPDVVKMEAEGNRRGIIAPWLSATRKLIMVVAPVCALLFVLRYEFITTLFTKTYAESAQIFGINQLKTLSMIVIVGSIMRAFESFKFFHLKLNLALLPISWLFLYIGVKSGGLMGAVIAAVVIHLLDVTINLIVSVRKIGVERKDLTTLAPALKVIPAVAVAYALTFVVKMGLASAHSIVIILACCAVFGLTYCGMIFFGGALTGEEKAQLRAFFRNFQQRFSSSYVS